MLQQNHYFHVE